MRIAGLDLSLASTGLVTATRLGERLDGGARWSVLPLRLRPPVACKGHERLSWMLDRIAMHTYHCDWVILEGPALGINLPGTHERAGLWWHVAHGCWNRHQPYDVVTPGTLKVFATGNGKAEKDQVLAETIKRYGTYANITGNDVADALVLAAMGCAYIGQPMAQLPKEHTRALKAVKWGEQAQEWKERHAREQQPA